MKITKLTPEEIEKYKISEEEFERRALQKAIEDAGLDTKMDITPVVGEERERSKTNSPEEVEDIKDIDYNKLPRNSQDRHYWEKLRRMFEK